MIRLLLDIPRALLRCVFYILYGLSFCVPRSKRVWLFDEWGGKRFADNARYLYLYMHNNQTHLKAVWITHSDEIAAELTEQGFHAYHAYSLQGLWYTLRAKVIVIESHISAFYFLTGGMVKINLWHGLPIKKIVYDSAKTKKNNWVYTTTGLKRFYHLFFEPYKADFGDYVLSQSKSWRDFFSSAFRVDTSHVIVENQPRNEALLSSDVLVLPSEQRLIETMEAIRATKKVIMYLPTFRDGSNNPLEKSGLDFAALDAFLGKHAMHMYIKMHHELPPAGNQPFSNLSFLPAEVGAMLPLRFTDILLTDYSSVYIEFLVLDRPIVFFPFDLDTYTGQMREMYFDYEAITPGQKAQNVEALYQALIDAAKQPEAYAGERAKIRAMVLNPQPEKSASQVFARIERIVE